jgi:uncharacterized phage-associated protein
MLDLLTVLAKSQPGSSNIYQIMPTTQQIEKLGNALIYLSNGVSELSKTKILKLLFLIEEQSIKKHGYPFFGFNFELWQFGPVLKEVHTDLTSETLYFLSDYIKRDPYDQSMYQAAAEFNDSEFSDWDIEILDSMILFAKNKLAKDFVAITHAEGSLWKKTAIKFGVLEDLESRRIATTDHLIDFSMLFDDNDELKERYLMAVENLNAIHSLKD